MQSTDAAEQAYQQWREGLRENSEDGRGLPFADYGPALQYGAEARQRLGPGAAWDDAEPSLKTGWERAHATSSLTWSDARPAVRDAWNGDAHAV